MFRDPEPLRQVSPKVVCAVLGVTSKTVREMANKGIIKKLPGKQGVYDLTKIVPSYLEYKTGAKKGKVESERAKLVRQQERKLRLQNDKVAGKLIPTADASAIFAEYASAFRAGLNAMPGRLSSQLGGMSRPAAIGKLLQEEIDEFLTSAEAALTKLTSEDPATGDKQHGDLH